MEFNNFTLDKDTHFFSTKNPHLKAWEVDDLSAFVISWRCDNGTEIPLFCLSLIKIKRQDYDTLCEDLRGLDNMVDKLIEFGPEKVGEVVKFLEENTFFFEWAKFFFKY